MAVVLDGVADKIVLLNSTILFGDDAYLIYASFDPPGFLFLAFINVFAGRPLCFCISEGWATCGC